MSVKPVYADILPLFKIKHIYYRGYKFPHDKVKIEMEGKETVIMFAVVFAALIVYGIVSKYITF